MPEENKAIARRVYEIISTGNFGRASEIVDQDAPDNELRPGDPPAKLIETFAEAREGFREGLSVVVEDVMGNSPRCVPRIVTRAVTQFPSEGIAATGKRVEVRAIDMFRIREGKILEHWGTLRRTEVAGGVVGVS
jgi:predicted ester cyclase